MLKVKEKKQVVVLMAGLSNAGKSLILEQMKDKRKQTPVDEKFTVQKVKVENIRFNVYDMPGGEGTEKYLEQLMSFWSAFDTDSKRALIYVIDSTDIYQMENSLKKLKKLLRNKLFMKSPLLIFLNKQDLAGAGAMEKDTFSKLILQKLENELNVDCRYILIQPCSALTKLGLREGFRWLASLYVDISAIPDLYQPDTSVFKSFKKSAKGINVLMAGLENSGKSTILAKMTNKELVPFMKSNSMTSIIIDGTVFNVWRVSGKREARGFWKRYLKGMKILIFVIDSTTVSKFDEALNELKNLLNSKQLMCRPLLIFYNKIDSSDSVNVDDFKGNLRDKLFIELHNRIHRIQPCSALTKQGLLFGFGMLKILRDEQKKRGKEVGSKSFKKYKRHNLVI